VLALRQQVQVLNDRSNASCGVQKLRRVQPRTSALPFVHIVLAAGTDVAQIVYQRV
jgi:hypothetical protein